MKLLKCFAQIEFPRKTPFLLSTIKASNMDNKRVLHFHLLHIVKTYISKTFEAG